MVPFAPVITGATCSYILHSLSFHSKVILYYYYYYYYYYQWWCPSSLDVLGLRIPTPDLPDTPCYHVCPSFNTFPSDRCSITGNTLCIDFDIFWKQIITPSRFDIISLLSSKSPNELYIYIYISFVCFICDPYLSLLLVFVCCASIVMSHLAKD